MPSLLTGLCMKRAFALLPVMLALLFISTLHPIGVFGGKPEKAHVRWIKFENGKQVYGSDQFGNRVPDFSSAGYETGLKPIPDRISKTVRHSYGTVLSRSRFPSLSPSLIPPSWLKPQVCMAFRIPLPEGSASLKTG